MESAAVLQAAGVVGESEGAVKERTSGMELEYDCIDSCIVHLDIGVYVASLEIVSF